MGTFFVSYSIKSEDHQAVADAAVGTIQSQAYVSPPSQGWVTLYDEKSDTQDAYEIGRLGGDLSTVLNTSVMAFLVADSSLFVYYFFDNGDLLDEYNSSPIPHAAEADPDQEFRFNGRPEILMQHCVPGTDRTRIESALARSEALAEEGFASSISAEQRMRTIAQALLIDPKRAGMGFADVAKRLTGLPEAERYLKVDVRRSRRTPKGRLPPWTPSR